MKKNKITSLILTLGLVAGLSQVAFATPNDDVTTALTNSSLPATSVTKIENYLKTITLTQDQSTTLINQINKVQAIANSEGVTDLTKLSSSGRTQALDAVKAAASALNLTIQTSKDANGNPILTVLDANGNTVLTMSGNEALMKKTGNNSYLFILGSVMLGIASSSLFVIKKSL